MHAKAFSDGDMIKLGWNKFQEHVGLLLGTIIVSGILILLPLIITMVVDNGIIDFLGFILYYALAIFFGIGMMRISIAIAGGKSPEFSTLFSGADRMLPYLGVSILYGIIVMVGLFLFIIPGVIWGLKYMFAPYLVVDKKMGVMDALRESGEMTMGLKWDLLGFYMVSSVVVMLGAMAFYVGMIVTVPISMIAMAGVYLHLAKKA